MIRLVEAVVLTLFIGQPSCHWPMAVVFHRIVILIGALALQVVSSFRLFAHIPLISTIPYPLGFVDW